MRGVREDGARPLRGAHAPGAVQSRWISLIMWIPHQMRCGIHMILVRGAVPPGQPGRTGHTRTPGVAVSATPATAATQALTSATARGSAVCALPAYGNHRALTSATARGAPWFWRRPPVGGYG